MGLINGSAEPNVFMGEMDMQAISAARFAFFLAAFISFFSG